MVQTEGTAQTFVIFLQGNWGVLHDHEMPQRLESAADIIYRMTAEGTLIRGKCLDQCTGFAVPTAAEIEAMPTIVRIDFGGEFQKAECWASPVHWYLLHCDGIILTTAIAFKNAQIGPFAEPYESLMRERIESLEDANRARARADRARWVWKEAMRGTRPAKQLRPNDYRSF